MRAHDARRSHVACTGPGRPASAYSSVNPANTHDTTHADALLALGAEPLPSSQPRGFLTIESPHQSIPDPWGRLVCEAPCPA